MRMNKKIAKAATGVVLSLSLAIAGSGATAYASSSISGTIEGTVVTGKITTDRDSATATTTFSRTADISATAYVYYWDGDEEDDDKYYSVATQPSSAGGASAVATKKIGGADVIGGKGIHKVIYGLNTWGPGTTKIGDTPSNAIKK